MNPTPREALAAARAERERILGFRALSTADWRRVRDLDAQIVQLKREVARGPIEIAAPVEKMRAQLAALKGQAS